MPESVQQVSWQHYQNCSARQQKSLSSQSLQKRSKRTTNQKMLKGKKSWRLSPLIQTKCLWLFWQTYCLWSCRQFLYYRLQMA